MQSIMLKRYLCMLQKALGLGALGLVLLSSSCATIGPKKVVSSHTAYNDAVQLTITREVLGNIVRSRYSDPMQFLAVSAINAQFSVGTGGSASVGGLGETGAVGSVGGSISYSDSPTITFTPQSDAGFYKSLYAPFDVSETIGFGLSYRFAKMNPGWKNMTLLFSFASINGANDQVIGEKSSLYNQRIAALAGLLEGGATFQQVPDWDFDSMTIARDKITAEDYVEAFRYNLYFIDEEDGKNVRLARYRLVLALEVPDPGDPEVITALTAIGVTPGKSVYIFRPPTHATPGDLDPESIWVTPRSMADAINLATQFVEIPQDHNALVQPIKSIAADGLVLPPIVIRSSKDEPPHPYRIQHRGYWFYVDDTDLGSKIFLEVLVAAYSSRVGSRGAQDEGPQVVLPVGGG